MSLKAGAIANNILDMKFNNFDKKLLSNTSNGNVLLGEWLSVIKDGIKKTDSKIKKAEDLSLKSLNGEADLHEMMTSVAMAETHLKIAIHIKDTLLSAWQELMKLQL